MTTDLKCLNNIQYFKEIKRSKCLQKEEAYSEP